MHKHFSELKWTETTIALFEALSRGHILPLMYDLFEAGRLAMENFIVFLSMLFNLRFKVQDALHRALRRSQAWLVDCVNVMGIGSAPAQDFILYSYVLLAEDFHNALCRASIFPRSSIDLWLHEMEAIPSVGRNSLRDIQLTQVQNSLVSSISESALGHFKLTPSKAVTGDSQTGKPTKPKNDKSKKVGNNLATPPPKPTPTPPKPNVVTPPTPPAVTTGRSYCHFFSSTAGCARGPSCRHLHAIPPRGDPLRETTKKYLAERNIMLSPAFLREE
jgi:hypothetical protein